MEELILILIKKHTQTKIIVVPTCLCLMSVMTCHSVAVVDELAANQSKNTGAQTKSIEMKTTQVDNRSYCN